MFDNFELWKDLAFLEKFSDNFLRNEVKYYLELKRKDDPNVILKENVIFNYVKCVEKAYYDFLNKNDKKLVFIVKLVWLLYYYGYLVLIYYTKRNVVKYKFSK